MFGYGVFVLALWLLHPIAHYLVVLGLSHALAVVNAFVLYKRFVFRSNGSWMAEFVKFNVVQAALFVLNSVILVVLVEELMLQPVIGQGVAILVVAAVGFLGHRVFSFRIARPT